MPPTFETWPYMDARQFLVALALCALTHVAGASDGDCRGCFDSRLGRWFKGNTHSHSIILLRGVIPHGDSGAAAVALWYREHGYAFAVISDHNQLIDVGSPKMQRLQGDGFLLMPGVEITSDYRLWGAPNEGKRTIHTTALGVRALPSADFEGMGPREIVSAHIERARAAGGITILNHPNYRDQISAADVLGLTGLGLFEVYNGEPTARNRGGGGRPSTDQLWDALLTAGMRVYGVAADDAHYFKLNDFLTYERDTFALPGSGWVMVNARELTADAIVGALVRGEFYASTGVVLSAVRYDKERYVVAVDVAATRTSVAEVHVAEAAPVVVGDAPGVAIEFIAKDGVVVARTNSDTAELRLAPSYGYVRARITWVERVKTRLDAAPTLRRFVAWTQPVFLAPPSTVAANDDK